MSSEYDDGAREQALRRVTNVRTGQQIPFRDAPVEQVRELGVVSDTLDLAAWRAAMRAQPREPEQKKPHTRKETAFEKPQEFGDPRRER